MDYGPLFVPKKAANVKTILRNFDFTASNCPLLLDGFSSLEPIGRWTDGHQAQAILQPDGKWPRGMTLTIDARPFIVPDIGMQAVTIIVNGDQQQEFTFAYYSQGTKLEMEIALSEGDTLDPLRIAFHIAHPGQPSRCGMGNDDRYLGLLVKTIQLQFEAVETQDSSTSPYKGLPAHQFWRRSISAVEAHRVDPVTHARFQIGKNARVGTAGSCFAQHISRRIMASGFNYFVTENGEGLSEHVRRRNNYGVFSARYGNVYTTVQLLQLFEEAFAERAPLDRAWARPDGRFIDPFRQQIEPNGFADEEYVVAERQRHLAAVRHLFENTDVFIFTLGLTEAWRSREDGSVFSAAPGVVGGTFDPKRHEFVNFDVGETYAALNKFLEKFHHLNPNAKVLLTVSPVPLIATYEPRSVLVSTTYSKSVLRVAAEMAIKQFDWVDYFPSYEIITGSYSGGLYYEADYREVNELGVAHAMRCFMRHYIEGRSVAAAEIVPDAIREASAQGIICDEEIMDSVRG